MFKALVRSIKRTVDEREPRKYKVPALIVSLNGSTSPANRTNWTYVRVDLFSESTLHAAFNNTALNVEGMWVEVEITEGDDVDVRITGAYVASIPPTATETASRYNVPVHGANHQYPSETNIGPDPALVYQPAIQMLKTTGDGLTLTVSVQPLVYGVAGSYRYFPGQFVDLTSYVPSTASRILMALLYLDKATNSAAVIVGEEALDNGVAPIEFPTLPDNAHGSAYISLANGQTTISTATDITDIRRFLTDSGTPIQDQATEVGQILISTNGLTFEVAKPLVNIHGEILVNDTGLVVA